MLLHQELGPALHSLGVLCLLLSMVCTESLEHMLDEDEAVLMLILIWRML